jgi:predicted DNA-binding protein (MmcQ/YjbR family)
MNIEELRTYCLSIKGAEECMPFDENTLVYKIMNKMFAYFSLVPKEGDFFVNMKCEPGKSAQLREYYEGITFGYHSNKKHWISVYIQSDVPDRLIEELIEHSVEEVIKKLPKKQQEAYNFILPLHQIKS